MLPEHFCLAKSSIGISIRRNYFIYYCEVLFNNFCCFCKKKRRYDITIVCYIKVFVTTNVHSDYLT